MVAITFYQRLQFNAITKTKKEYDDECVCMIQNWQGSGKFRLYYIIVVNDISDKCYEIELILCLFFHRYEL